MGHLWGAALLNESQSRTEVRGIGLRQVVLGCASMLFGILLCALLLRWNGQGIGSWITRLRSLDFRWAGVALAGMAINAILAAQKWRLVEGCLAGSPPPFTHAVGLTALAGGVGQFLPAPIATAIVRGLGNRVSSRSGRQGALASVWEQLFDLAAALVLTGPAIFVLLRHDATLLIPGVLVAAVLGEFGAVVLPRAVARVVPIHDGLITRPLCTLLWRLSLARALVLISVTVVIARAMAFSAAPAYIAASVPPVIVASVISFIPAGIGVNELSFVGLLALTGASLRASSTFALINRGLQLAIALILASIGLLILVGRASYGRFGPPPSLDVSGARLR